MLRKRTTVPHACERCGETFNARVDGLKNGNSRFCSRSCARRPPPDAMDIQADGTARIPLRTGDGLIHAYAIIDAVDAEWASQCHWSLDKDGYVMRRQYLGGGRDHQMQRSVYLHRELLGLTHDDQMEGDHISRDTLDNRRVNLRALPRSGRPNTQNQGLKSNNKSGYRGVRWYKKIRKWQASVTVNGKEHYLGSYSDVLEAAEAARAGRARLLPYAID